jgi:asparagine synthase (glutamine-hydrolysing)
MPGVAGIIGQGRRSEECQNLVVLMARSMMHETFYASGTHFVPEMGIYTSWVAHENSFAASQVFFNEQRDIALLFSGECFTDPETRGELKRKGHELGEAAGGWLVHSYEEEGDEFFAKLNGLFSGLLIDKRRNRAFLFNDRYGTERIYWHQTNDAIYFASEAKALLRVLPELRGFDEEGVAQFLAFGCTLEWRTLFQGVHLLPGGSLWTFERTNCTKRRYFLPSAWESQPTLTAEAFESRLHETFKRILPRYFESESKVGISLTGGLDTRMIMASLPVTANDPVCYTFSGDKRATVDARLSARVAEACGLEHRILRIGPDFFADFASHADRTVYITDGCFGILGAHEIYLNKKARQLAPVRLTGNYGSEILRGVSTFKFIGLSPALFNREFGPVLNSSSRSLAYDNGHPVTFAAFREIPWGLFFILAADRSQVSFRTPYLDNELVALAYQSPERFRKSPLPASRFVKANSGILNEIPTDRGFAGDNSGLEFLFRRFFAEATFKIDYYNSEGLPHSLSPLDAVFRRVSSSLGILGLHKYLSYRHWFRKELAGYVNDKLAAAHIRQTLFWNPDILNSMAKDHLRGRRNYVREINAVLTLEAVERLLFRDLPTGFYDSKDSGTEGQHKEPVLTA